ncbi:halo transducer protein [Halorubrum sp. AS12]|uniref:halo transducer protein n=1 Tax=Halorubrum sp. AS12 TaxID=3409687 RepID=UPI003DA6EE42
MTESAPVEAPLDELVETAVDQTGEDPESIRTWLEPFTDDGAVTPAAVEATVTDVSQVLATAETRVDLATRAHESASDAAADVPDLDIVAVRRRAFEERLADLRADVEALGGELGSAADDLDSAADVYEAAVDLHEITTGAREIVRVAHDLETELEAFEAWLSSANRRHDALVDEVESAEESAAAVAETVEALRAADAPEQERWFDATVQTRVLEVAVADLRAEAADLRTWAEGEGVSFPDDIETRIDEVEHEAAANAEALADRPSLDARFADRLEALETELAAVSPPVAWGRVDEAVATAREGVSGDPSGD